MAGVIAIFLYHWQMLLPIFVLVADGKTTFRFQYYGWCYAMVAGVIAT